MASFVMPELYRNLASGTPDEADAAIEEGLVVIFTGRKRQGKSLSAAAICYDAHLTGVTVYHNGSLKFGQKVDWGKIARLEYSDCYIFIDEAHEWLDPRRSMSQEAIEASNYLTQVGKLNNTLIVATHRLNLLDLRIREAADLHIRVRKDHYLGPKLLYWDVDDINDVFAEVGRSMTVKMHNMNEYYNVYDTKALFDTSRQKRNARTVEMERKFREYREIEIAVASYANAGHERVSAGEIAAWLDSERNFTLSPSYVGLIMTNHLGIPKRRAGGVRFFDLSNVQVGVQSP